MVRLTSFEFLPAPLATLNITTLFLCCLVLLASLPGAAAGLSTRTIDDQAGDSVTGVVPLYQGQWSLGSNCTNCALKPNPAKTFGGSWHDSTVQGGDFKNVIITFTGTAINVFGIIPRYIDNFTITNTNLNFVLDEKPSSTKYIQAGLDPSSPDAFLYNQSVYSVSGLSNTPHTLRIEPQVGDSGSVFLFDYAAYTFEGDAASPQTSTSSGTVQPTTSQPVTSQTAETNGNSFPVAAIVAGVVIGILLFALLVFLMLWYHRRRHTGPVGHIEDRVDFSRKSPVVPVAISFNRPSSPSPSSVFSIKPLPKEPLSQVSALSARSSLDIPTRSVTPSLSYAGSEPNQIGKASQREAELERQLADARAALDGASSSGSGGLARNLSTITTFKRTSLSAADETQLRAQVQNLQIEVDRLRAATREVEAPPAYV